MRVNVYLKRWTRILALSHVTWPHCHFLVPIPEHSLSTNSSSASTIRRNFKSRRSRSTPQSCETWSLISPDVPKPKIACKNLQKNRIRPESQPKLQGPKFQTKHSTQDITHENLACFLMSSAPTKPTHSPQSAMIDSKFADVPRAFLSNPFQLSKNAFLTQFSWTCQHCVKSVTFRSIERETCWRLPALPRGV